jgi:hypothetical protein
VSVATPAARAALVERLRRERPRLEQAIHARIRDVAPGPDDESAEYEAGQYAAIVETVDFTLAGIELGEISEQPIPPATIAQARRAARHGVALDTVLRRYHTAQGIFVNRVKDDLEHTGPAGDPAALELFVSLQELHNRLTAEVAREYAHEMARGARSIGERRAERVERLLSGASFDTSGLDYAFEKAWHICVIAVGATAEPAVRTLASALNRQLLVVPRSEEIVWAWFGSPRPLSVAEVEAVRLGRSAQGVNLALGEPDHGFEGWRMTFKHAQAALRIAFKAPRPLTRYADVSLLEAVTRDHALALSYVAIHLAPLDDLRVGGLVARETLRAYFQAGHHVDAAARLLNVHRATLRNRIARIEARLGYQLSTRQAELEIALRVEALLAARPR